MRLEEKCSYFAAGNTNVGIRPFSPNSKCCTYVPLLPNYLVGNIIKDHSEEAQFGRTKLLDRLKQRVGATPFGMVVDAHSDRIYAQLVAKDQFGRDDSFLGFV